MARIVKEQEYGEKRNAILDAAQELVETKGYEQMAIQDLLNELQISRGAFYHYFDSKQALLEALVERILNIVEQRLLPIVQDTQLAALDKLQRFFATLVSWKTDQRPLVLALLHVWYTDDNVLVRQKLRTARARRFIPLLTKILRQGITEGSVHVSYPEQAGGVVLSLVEELSDTLAILILVETPTQNEAVQIERVVAGSTEAMERVLGVSGTSLQIVDAQSLKQWFDSLRNI